MIDLSDLIHPDAVMPAVKATGKRQLLQLLAEKAAALTGKDERQILDLLVQREKLGSTGVGGGVAIPHARVPGLTRMFGVLARVPAGVEFEALDEQPVDLVVLILGPETAGVDHLKALARIARGLRDPEVLARLRATTDGEALYGVIATAKPDAA